MGIESLSGNMKHCILCQFFDGKREVITGGSGVRYEQAMQGMCIGGGKNKQKVGALSSCPKFTRWATLR